MIVTPTADFNKSIKKITDKIARKRLRILIEKLEKAKDLSEIPNVKAISNYPGRYRIRTGDYRLFVKQIAFNAIEILLIEYRKRDDNTYQDYK